MGAGALLAGLATAPSCLGCRIDTCKNMAICNNLVNASDSAAPKSGAENFHRGI